LHQKVWVIFVAGKQFERSLFLCTDKEQPSGFNQQNFGLRKPQRCRLVQVGAGYKEAAAIT
jgi:hypothetical protein